MTFLAPKLLLPTNLLIISGILMIIDAGQGANTHLSQNMLSLKRSPRL